MDNETIWIKNILVDDTIHSIREAAAKGDIFSMIRLATYLSEAKNAPFQLDHFMRLMIQIESHPEQRENPFQWMEYCKAKADLNVYLFNAGKLTEHENLLLQRHAYQDYFKAATDLPKDLWDLREMKMIFDWLYEDSLGNLESTN